MPKLRVHNFSISVDGYGAGPGQTLEDPLGKGGTRLHEWVFAPDRPALDDEFLRRGDDGIGATLMGRNMFGPIRGAWEPDDAWRGWWGDEPPYHHAVFVLTHHAHDPIEMDGGTTFHFVTEGLDVGLARAFEAAGGGDVRVGGGASTVQQCLRAGLVDELHLTIAPVLLGSGERLFDHLDGGPEGLECVEMVGSKDVTHVRFERSS